MCGCDDNGFVCARCADTARDPRYLDVEDGRFLSGPLATPTAVIVVEKDCPRCGTAITDDACDRCGWSLVEEQSRARLKVRERETDWLPRLPLALTLDDEYAPAQTDEEAA